MAKLKEILGEDIFKQLSAEKQKEYETKELEEVSNGAFIPKKRFDEVNDESKAYKKQVSEREKQLADVKEEFKDAAGLKEKFELLEKENKLQKETLEKQLADITFDNALEKALGNYKLKDKEVVLKLLDKTKLKPDGADILGFKEQMEEMQKNKEYLFEKEVKGTGNFNTGGGESKPTGEEDIAVTLGKQQAENMKGNSGFDKFIAK